ncbi:MAG: RraA family protein [Streptosporangiaceae bacterium]
MTTAAVTGDMLAEFARVARCYSASAVFADVQGRAGVMHSSMKPTDREGVLVGRALTVQLSPGDLQDPLAALDIVRAGDVPVVGAGGETETSVWGGLMGSLFKLKGSPGAVIDGACRDCDENRDQGFRVFARSVTPRGTHTMFSGRKDNIALQVPVTCGGVLVRPGDVIVGDELGVTVIASEHADETLRLARDQAEREEATREKIAAGWNVEQLLAEFGRL